MIVLFHLQRLKKFLINRINITVFNHPQFLYFCIANTKVWD